MADVGSCTVLARADEKKALNVEIVSSRLNLTCSELCQLTEEGN